jgi:hypothetical protein
MAAYTVAEGDCFDSIAKANGFFDYQTIYKNGNNKTQWPNPNMLVIGGTVDIPAKTVKKVDLKLDKTVKAVVKRKKTRLRLVPVDSSFKALKIDACKATVSIEYPQKPDGTGLLELSDIDPSIKDGMLLLNLKVPPKPAAPAPAAPAVDPKAYPIAVVANDFVDKNPKAEDHTKVEWVLKIGQLEPHTTVRGVLQRLINLGFGCPAQTSEDDKTSRAVKAYQLNIELKKGGQETGLVSDIRDDIKKRHDKL